MMSRWASAQPGKWDSMDLTKVLAAWRNRPPEQWLALVNRVVPPIVVVALVIFLAFQAAGLTWRLLEQPTRQEEVPPAVLVAVANLPRSGSSGNLAVLDGWEPFGREPDAGAAAIPAEDILEAPPTQLNLRLAAVLQSQELPERGSMVIPEEGLAAIATGGGTPTTYHTGETIEGTGARLHSVIVNCAMLDPGTGTLESLCFPTAEELAQQAGRPVSGPNQFTRAPTRPPQTIGTPPSAAVETMSSAAVQFNQHIQVRQAIEGENVIGFRLEPRNDSPVMSQLGLEPGDVLTEVNGVRLSDLRNTTAVVQALQESPQANVKIRRNGVDIPMTIDMGQIARLAESLQ